MKLLWLVVWLVVFVVMAVFVMVALDNLLDAFKAIDL